MSEHRRRRLLWIALPVGIVLLVLVVNPTVQFLTGGLLVNLGFRLQDHHHAFDLARDDATPAAVWEALMARNALASTVRARLPRSVEHPAVALVVCMDARIDTAELVGDTRHHYFVIRTAGSVLGPAEQEMLELAVHKGVKLIVLTTHTDCAAEHVSADPALRREFPALTQLIDQRELGVREFLARPLVRARIAGGGLLVKRALLDTANEALHPVDAEPRAQTSRK